MESVCIPGFGGNEIRREREVHVEQEKEFHYQQPHTYAFLPAQGQTIMSLPVHVNQQPQYHGVFYHYPPYHHDQLVGALPQVRSVVYVPVVHYGGGTLASPVSMVEPTVALASPPATKKDTAGGTLVIETQEPSIFLDSSAEKKRKRELVGGTNVDGKNKKKGTVKHNKAGSSPIQELMNRYACLVDHRECSKFPCLWCWGVSNGLPRPYLVNLDQFTGAKSCTKSEEHLCRINQSIPGLIMEHKIREYFDGVEKGTEKQRMRIETSLRAGLSENEWQILATARRKDIEKLALDRARSKAARFPILPTPALGYTTLEELSRKGFDRKILAYIRRDDTFYFGALVPCWKADAKTKNTKEAHFVRKALKQVTGYYTEKVMWGIHSEGLVRSSISSLLEKMKNDECLMHATGKNCMIASPMDCKRCKKSIGHGGFAYCLPAASPEESLPQCIQRLQLELTRLHDDDVHQEHEKICLPPVKDDEHKNKM